MGEKRFDMMAVSLSVLSCNLTMKCLHKSLLVDYYEKVVIFDSFRAFVM